MTKNQAAKNLLLQMDSLKECKSHDGNTIGQMTLLILTLNDAERLVKDVLRTTTLLERSNRAILNSLRALGHHEQAERFAETHGIR